MPKKNKYKKKSFDKAGCENCSNLIAIGGGDHICDACEGRNGEPCAIVIEKYMPGRDYLICKGRKWKP